jgi:uncharacterized protein YdhG (YjbR/CyaY superfamily)
MGKRTIQVEIGEKRYVLEFTRGSICKAEEAFGVSMMKTVEFNDFGEFNRFVNALLYGALTTHQPDIAATPIAMETFHEQLNEAGYDESDVIESLVKLLGDTINPTTGGQKKTLLTVKK